MNEALRTQYEEQVNLRRFFTEHYPNENFIPPSYFIEDQECPQFKTYGYDLTPPRPTFITLGNVKYRLSIIYKDENGIWQIGIVRTDNRTCETIPLNIITMGWVNKYSKKDEFYEEELKAGGL